MKYLIILLFSFPIYADEHLIEPQFQNQSDEYIQGYVDGYDEGEKNGYISGWNEGYRRGYDAGSYDINIEKLKKEEHTKGGKDEENRSFIDNIFKHFM